MIRRRDVLAGGLGAALSGCAPAPPAQPSHPAAVPATAHQPGVVDRPATHARLAAFDLKPTGRAEPAGLLRRLGERVRAANAAAGQTVTAAYGSSLFDSRFGLAAVRPRRLTEMPSFPNDVLDPAWCHGDLLLQICAETADQVAAVTADLVTSAGGLRPRWHLNGFREGNGAAGDGRYVDRNLFGFREGAGNPDVHDPALMDQLVWVTPGVAGEPAWTAGGTYQVVRLIRFATRMWEAEPVDRQEQIFGRHKSDGAPLGQGRETDEPAYARDPDGAAIPLDAHIRRANPRTPETAGNRILRRGYSYRRSATDEGLAFVCFQSDVERGFATVQRRLAGEALDRYVLTYGGGYWFVPSVAGQWPKS